MSNIRLVRKTNDPTKPTWCAHCCVRIAPSERHTVKRGKTYHETCLAKHKAQNSQN